MDTSSVKRGLLTARPSVRRILRNRDCCRVIRRENKMATGGMNGLYSDEVFTATELNRRVGTVLDHARIRPVTISRNNELFALVRREYAAQMIQTVRQMRQALSALVEMHVALAGDPVAPTFSWLEVFEKDDLQRLISEVFSAVGKAVSGATEWGEVEAVIHEWKESAQVAKSGILDAAMFEDLVEECPLFHPDDVLQYQEPLMLTTGPCQEPKNS